jgi:hypothetical protein
VTQSHTLTEGTSPSATSLPHEETNITQLKIMFHYTHIHTSKPKNFSSDPTAITAVKTLIRDKYADIHIYTVI